MKHSVIIPKGEHTELSKVLEEVMELQDAHIQKDKVFVAVEASDIINAIGRFTWSKYKVPLFAIIFLYYVRLFYKPVKRLKIKDLK